MSLYRDEGVVLRAQKLGEADRIITLLTREHGRVRAVAKGVRRTTSRFGARLEPFMLRRRPALRGPLARHRHPGRDASAPYGTAIAADYARYTAGTAMLETAERLTETSASRRCSSSCCSSAALRTLAEGRHEPSLVLDAFLLRSLAVAGWAPSFTDCARCGEPGPHRASRVPRAAPSARECRPAGSAAPHPETFALLAALLAGDWDGGRRERARHRREGSGLVAAYLQWHLERGLRSLRLVER